MSTFNWSVSPFAVAFIIAAACASYGTPVQHMAEAEASVRSAHDSYAAATPSAQLHLKLAEEAVARAKRLIDEGDYRRADFTLVRARSDANLAVAEERQAQAEGAAQQARDALEGQGIPTSTTRTTGAVVPAPSLPLPMPATGTPENGGSR